MTPGRCVRIPDELWDAALAQAAADGTSVTAVIVEALTEYTR